MHPNDESDRAAGSYDVTRITHKLATAIAAWLSTARDIHKRHVN
jgi:hypothetical protein